MMTEKFKTNISEISLNYKRKIKASERPKVSSSQDAEKLFRENWNDLTINLFEEFKILFLDRNNSCMGIVLKLWVMSLIFCPKISPKKAFRYKIVYCIVYSN